MLEGDNSGIVLIEAGPHDLAARVALSLVRAQNSGEPRQEIHGSLVIGEQEAKETILMLGEMAADRNNIHARLAAKTLISLGETNNGFNTRHIVTALSNALVGRM